MDLRRGRRGRSEGENAQLSCPVCFDDDVTESSYFPCGHSVCAACNASLLRRGFLACPTCRTPRDGVSQAAVEHANQERVRQNDEDERGNAGTGIGMTISHAGERYRILFFPDESQGSPFGTLGRPALGGRGARPVRSARTLRMAPPYHTRIQRYNGQRRTMRRREEEEGEPAEAGEEEENMENGENVPPGVEIGVGAMLQRLVNGLLVPTTLSEFLARRRRV